MPTRLAFLWHMHQPMYTDPVTGTAVLPWVRFHATQSYYDMARMLERYPAMRATVNFVPSLVEQLSGAADGSLPEQYVQLSRKRAQDLSADDRLFVLRQFFMANADHAIQPRPRYAELWSRRGEAGREIDASQFDEGDLRDLQVHFNLAWMGFSARAEEPIAAQLIAKDRGFSEDEKTALLDAQQRIVARVLPLWRKLSESGRIEISSTPYYHPILPLLCDTDSARRAMPDSPLPPRFQHPDDAREQVRLAMSRHKKTFGRDAAGMWPAEGSVSPEALEILASEGIHWAASDEAVLFKSTPAPVERGQLYQAWRYEPGGKPISMMFRDHALSDRIGFAYGTEPAADSSADFLARIRTAASDAKNAGIANAIVPVILDGENAWEHFDGQGEPFLDALYRALTEADDIQTVTMSEATKEPTGNLTTIHTGSWIESNFHIWIGQTEDNLAWELLGQVRAMLAAHEARGDVQALRLAEARTLILSAEGSDWFWWYGDDFETKNAAEFDFLFRDRLLRAVSLLGETPPARLNEPISQQARDGGRAHIGLQQPTSLIQPLIDGRAGSWLRWRGSGVIVPKGGQGAMYRSTHVILSVNFGFDAAFLYLRVECGEPLDGAKLSVNVKNGRGSVKTVSSSIKTGALRVTLTGAKGAYQDVVEMALPLAGLSLAEKDRAVLEVRLERDGKEVDRVPPRGELVTDVPGPDFEQRLWLA